MIVQNGCTKQSKAIGDLNKHDTWKSLNTDDYKPSKRIGNPLILANVFSEIHKVWRHLMQYEFVILTWLRVSVQNKRIAANK